MAKKWEVSYLLDFYGDVLTEKQRDVMVQYYNDDYSLAEIAENFGITRQGVRDAIKRGEATLLELEEKIGFAARSRALREGISQLEALAREVRFPTQAAMPRTARWRAPQTKCCGSSIPWGMFEQRTAE